MKKKLALCMAVCAFAGLSACHKNVPSTEAKCTDEAVEATSLCVPGAERCAGDIHQTCNDAGTAYEDIDCPGNFPARPHCDATDVCVQCAKDSDCAANLCDTVTHTCVVPAITSCHSQKIDVAAKTAYGRVLDPRTTKDASTIDPMILCGTDGQTIGEYNMLLGSPNPACSDCGDHFEFMADLSSLAAGDYLCMWVFTIVDGALTACQTDGTAVVSDRSFMPTAANALAYTVAP